MKHTLHPPTGSADRWGPLWGHRAEDWAASEDQQAPTYAAGLDRLDLQPGQRVLDVGCGSGAFLALAAARHLEAHGIDASTALLDLARARPGVVPDHVRHGDMDALPYADATFDAVTGFNAFFFAQDMVGALREAGRVARPGAPVLIQVFGPPEQCDLEACKAVIRPYLPAPPPDAPAAPQLWRPGALEGLARAAGLAPATAFAVSYPFDYPDAATLGRRLMAPAGIARLVGPDHEDEVRAAIVAALAACRRADGSYRLDNTYNYLIATAP